MSSRDRKRAKSCDRQCPARAKPDRILDAFRLPFKAAYHHPEPLPSGGKSQQIYVAMNSAANLPGSAFAGYPPPGFNYYEQSPYQQNPSPGQQTMALPSYAEASSLPVRSSPYHPPPPPPHAQGFNNGAPSQPPQQYTGQAPLSHPPQPASALLSPRTPFSHRGGQPGQGPRNSNRFKPRNARREEGEVSEESGVYTPTSWNSGDANSYTPNPFPLDGAADSPQSSVSQKGYSVAQWQPSLLPAHESPANHHTDQLWKRSAASQPSSPQLPPGLPTLKKPSALSRQLETDDAGHAQSHAVKTSGHQQPQATIQLRDERKWAVDALKWLNSNGVTPEAVFELLQVKPDQVQELCRLVREAGLPVPATLAAAPSAPAAVGSGFTVEQPPCTDASVNGSEVKQDKAPVKVNGSVAKAPLSQESVKSAAQRPVQETPPASLPAKPAKEAMPASLPAKPAKTEGSRQEYIARLQAAKAKKSGIAQEGVSASPVDHRGAEPLLRGSGAQGNGVSQPTAVNGVAKVTTSASSASDVSTPTMSNSDLQTQTSSRVESVSAEDTVPRTTALVSAVPPIPGLFLGGQQSGPASLPSKPVSFTIPVPKTRQQNLAGTATNTKVSELKSQAAPSLSRRSSSFANCRDHQERVVIEVSGDEDSEMEDAPPIKSAGAHTPQQPEPVDLKLKQARIEEEKRQLAKKIAMLEQRRLAKQSATLTIPKKALFSAPMSPAPVDNGVGTSTGAPKPQQSDAGKAMAEVPKLPIDVPKLPVEAPKLPVEIAKPHSIIAEKAPVEVPLAKIDVVAARTKTFPAPEAGASKEFEVSHPPQVIGVKRSASTDANPEVKKKRADILSRMLALQMELAQLGDEPAEATDESPAPPMVTAEVVEEVRRSESVVMQEPIKEVPVSEPAVVQKIVEEVPASEPAVVQKTVETMPVSEPAALQTTVEEASASEPVVVTSSETTPDAAVPSASESELYEPTGSMDTPMEIDDESDSDDAMEISSSESGEIRSPSPVSPAVTAPIPGRHRFLRNFVVQSSHLRFRTTDRTKERHFRRPRATRHKWTVLRSPI
ncbi:hypothetical protein EJ06DRAFT_523433 [Trichodelitschia bisporula]|uniref:Uncharacterized protein n=1 Tax=Trichodelitschia bisporula TaxID=703511 RepID=A0A6G1HQB7_9PEZI|nr:hypothetical protein EJ06DRAFT_523433 [Trichodelitschia bisporula]